MKATMVTTEIQELNKNKDEIIANLEMEVEQLKSAKNDLEIENETVTTSSNSLKEENDSLKIELEKLENEMAEIQRQEEEKEMKKMDEDDEKNKSNNYKAEFLLHAIMKYNELLDILPPDVYIIYNNNNLYIFIEKI